MADATATDSARVRAAPDQRRLRLCAGHRHPRRHAAGRQYALWPPWRRAQRQLGAPARQLSRLRLHAGFGHRRQSRHAASTSARRCATPRNTLGRHWRRASAPAWGSTFRIASSGRARVTTMHDKDTDDAKPVCADFMPSRRTTTLLPRLSALVGPALEGGARLVQYRNKNAADAAQACAGGGIAAHLPRP